MKRRVESAVVMFDVTYVDGTQSSRRKVPKLVADGPDGNDAAKAAIEAQDRDISLASGRPRADIRTVVRSRV